MVLYAVCIYLLYNNLYTIKLHTVVGGAAVLKYFK
jgi:hypothetical protein